MSVTNSERNIELVSRAVRQAASASLAALKILSDRCSREDLKIANVACDLSSQVRLRGVWLNEARECLEYQISLGIDQDCITTPFDDDSWREENIHWLNKATEWCNKLVLIEADDQSKAFVQGLIS